MENISDVCSEFRRGSLLRKEYYGATSLLPFHAFVHIFAVELIAATVKKKDVYLISL